MKIQNLISVQDFAEQMKTIAGIGQNKIYAMVKEPGFPAVKLGGRYYVLVDRVNEWLEQQTKKNSNDDMYCEKDE